MNELNMSFKVAAEPKIIDAREQVKQAYLIPVRWWKVETEGDEEGRKTRQLGQYYGHFAEIAFSLAHEQYYELNFTALDNPAPKERPFYTPTRKTVSVSFNIASGTWDLRGEARIKYFRSLIPHNAPIRVIDSHFYKAITLELK